MSPDASASAARRTPARGASERNAAFAGGLLGFVAGAVLSHTMWGALSGAGIGAAFLLWSATSRRAADLEGALERLGSRVDVLERGAAPSRAGEVGSGEVEEEARAEAPARAEPSPAPAAASASPPTAVSIDPAARRPPRSPRPGPFDEALAALRGFFLGGNTVVRVGIVVLLIGVALLAKWAADHALFPIEARLAAAAAIGVALAAVGFSLRERRPGFASTLQGGGVAALYLVVFFAYRAYGLVPAPLAFALFVAIAAACGTLALLQRSQPLIFIGSVGGFLSPILASTGAGDHVLLFTYYLLLDVAIAAVAWRESWRSLNLLAFVATYGVATTWGVLRYRPEHFASTEPFLLAFWLLFTGVAVISAWRRAPELRGLVDGTLVFGTPLLTLLAQAKLVEGRTLGMALSTAGFGLCYAALASWVWRRAPGLLRPVAEAFVALAVVFGTIAIPLALDDALTTTLAWSLEGAGLYWVGTRQARRLPRLAGIGLQALAALAFAFASELSGFATRAPDFLLVANPRFLSCASLTLAGAFIAREAHRRRDALEAREWQATQLGVGWALLWWSGGLLAEIDQFAPEAYRVAAALLAFAATFPLLERAAARLDWTPGRLASALVLPVGFAAIPFGLDQQEHLFAGGGLLAWPLFLLAVYDVLGRLESCGIAWTRTAYAPALWLLAGVTALGLGGAVDPALGLYGDWPGAAFGIGLAAVTLAAGHAVDRGWGAFARFPAVHLGAGVAPLVALGAAWIAALCVGARGDAEPLPYLPLVNPGDAATALLLLAGVDAWLRAQRQAPPALPSEWRGPLGVGLAGLLFAWLNAVLARSVHQWSEVPWRVDALWDSTPLQASMSIGWTVVALAGMLACTRRGWRPGWIAASTLLGATVLKLFLVDLSTLSTGARIGTFLVVGVLLLVVGYLSPVPPAGATPVAGDAGAPPSGGGPIS